MYTYCSAQGEVCLYKIRETKFHLWYAELKDEKLGRMGLDI
jgi:hypothetical protein